MSFYESVIIARQEISVQQVETLADDFSSIIEENGGKITKRENWGLRSLAYKIKKNRKGHYILFNIDAPAEAIHEMDRLLGLNEDVLRHLVLRLDELDNEPSIQMQNRASREDRPREGGYENKPTEEKKVETAPAKSSEDKADENPPAETAEETAEETA